jgi:hypothetical protein
MLYIRNYPGLLGYYVSATAMADLSARRAADKPYLQHDGTFGQHAAYWDTVEEAVAMAKTTGHEFVVEG